MRGLKDSLERFVRQIETLPIGVAGVMGLAMGLLAGVGTLLETGGNRGLLLFGVALVFPALLGIAARPVLVPESAEDQEDSITGFDDREDKVIDRKTETSVSWPATEAIENVDAPSLEEKPVERIIAPLLEMVPIPAGNFLMGSDENESMAQQYEFPAHKVNLSTFHLARSPLTRGQYIAVMGEEHAPDSWPKNQNPKLPANYLSWFDAVDFCNALSEREGFEPCYTRDENSVQWLREADGYRLPTEAEWEYACRAGSTSPWFFGDDEEKLKDYGWYGQNSDGKIQPVAQLKPNDFELYDMAGNVWEWCWDWYGDYAEKEQSNPGGSEDGALRSLRGGSAWNGAQGLRSANRFWDRPVLRGVFIGFRCARAPAASH